MIEYKIFGCKINKYYLNQWLDNPLLASLAAPQSGGKSKNVLLISTCEVTDRAKSKWLHEAKKALKDGKVIGITGCWVLRNGKVMDESDFFIIYPELLEWKDNIMLLGESPEKDSRFWILDPRKNPPPDKSGSPFNKGGIYTKHFLMIQNGCDNHCSFCLTVKKRWKSWSRPIDEIIEEIKMVEARGTKEIVLTGVNLMAWGASDTRKPEESRFSELLEEILKQTEIPRIRISSIWPEYVNDRFFEIINNKRIMPHFHFSVQSFSDNVLRRMGRGYDKKILENVLRRTKESSSLREVWSEMEDDVAIHSSQSGLLQKTSPTPPYKGGRSVWADLIVGFPWESEEDFEETMKGVKEFGINKLHVFPFSAHRKGDSVPAGQFDGQVSVEVKKEREKRLIELGAQIRSDFLYANEGLAHEVLIEEKKNGKWRWWTENYIQVELEGNYERWEIAKVEILERKICKVI